MDGLKIKVLCYKCGGSGSTNDGRRDCPVCRGTGRVEVKR